MSDTFREKFLLILADKLLLAVAAGVIAISVKAYFDSVAQQRQFEAAYAATLADKRLAGLSAIWSEVFATRHGFDSFLELNQSGADANEQGEALTKTANNVWKVVTEHGIYLGDKWSTEIGSDYLSALYTFANTARTGTPKEIQDTYDSAQAVLKKHLLRLEREIRDADTLLSHFHREPTTSLVTAPTNSKTSP